MTQAVQEAGPWVEIDNWRQRTLPSSPLFGVVEVILPESGDHFVVKTADTERGRQHLGNSVAWSQSINGYNPTTFAIPGARAGLTVEETEGGREIGTISTSVAHFDWVEGKHITEDALGEHVEPLAEIIHEMSDIEFAWSGSAHRWLAARRDDKVQRGLAHLGDDARTKEVMKLLSNDNILAAEGGVTHGDLSPTKNILISADGKHNLLDAEFGTHPARPAYAVPHRLDAAYLYHLLQVQYEQPETAHKFTEKMDDAFGWNTPGAREFWHCVLERTVSMYYNFIAEPNPHATVDVRRTKVANYVRVLDVAIERLQATQ